MQKSCLAHALFSVSNASVSRASKHPPSPPSLIPSLAVLLFIVYCRALRRSSRPLHPGAPAPFLTVVFGVCSCQLPVFFGFEPLSAGIAVIMLYVELPQLVFQHNVGFPQSTSSHTLSSVFFVRKCLGRFLNTTQTLERVVGCL